MHMYAAQGGLPGPEPDERIVFEERGRRLRGWPIYAGFVEGTLDQVAYLLTTE